MDCRLVLVPNFSVRYFRGNSHTIGKEVVQLTLGGSTGLCLTFGLMSGELKTFGLSSSQNLICGVYFFGLNFEYPNKN